MLRSGITAELAEAQRIAKRAWCHLAGHICEVLCVPKVLTRENWREHVDVSELDAETAHLIMDPPEGPILFVSGHHGVWEVATNTLSFVRPMIVVAKVQKNRWVANWMKQHHFRGPVTLVDKNHGFTSQVLRQWDEEKAALTILMDQHAGRGALLRFMGRPARTHTSAARLAIRTGYPVVVGSFVRDGAYRYRIVAETVRFSREVTREDAAQRLTDIIEKYVRRYPEQYLWAHRRWRDD